MTTAPQAVPTIAVFPEENLTLSQRVEKWVWQLCRALEADYDRRYPESSQPVRFSVELGRKYWKINQSNGGVHAFVDRKTGQVYKPASWRGPAKGVRYDLRIISQRDACLSNADWAGGYLYLR
jgi:hypothetical protein